MPNPTRLASDQRISEITRGVVSSLQGEYSSNNTQNQEFLSPSGEFFVSLFNNVKNTFNEYVTKPDLGVDDIRAISNYLEILDAILTNTEFNTNVEKTTLQLISAKATELLRSELNRWADEIAADQPDQQEKEKPKIIDFSNPWESYAEIILKVPKIEGESAADRLNRQKKVFYRMILSVFAGTYVDLNFGEKPEGQGPFNPLSWTVQHTNNSTFDIETIISKGLGPKEGIAFTNEIRSFMKAFSSGETALTTLYDGKYESVIDHLTSKSSLLSNSEEQNLKNMGENFTPLGVDFYLLWQKGLNELVTWQERYVYTTDDEDLRIWQHTLSIFDQGVNGKPPLKSLLPQLSELQSLFNTTTKQPKVEKNYQIKKLCEDLGVKTHDLYKLSIQDSQDRAIEEFRNMVFLKYQRTIIKIKADAMALGPKIAAGRAGDKSFFLTYSEALGVDKLPDWQLKILGSDTIPLAQEIQRIRINLDKNPTHYEVARQIVEGRILDYYLKAIRNKYQVKGNTLQEIIQQIQINPNEMALLRESYGQALSDEKILATVESDFNDAVTSARLLSESYAEGQGWLIGNDRPLLTTISKAPYLVDTSEVRSNKTGEGPIETSNVFLQLLPLPQDYKSGIVTLRDPKSGRYVKVARSLSWINKELLKNPNLEFSLDQPDSSVKNFEQAGAYSLNQNKLLRDMNVEWNSIVKKAGQFSGSPEYNISEKVVQEINAQILRKYEKYYFAALVLGKNRIQTSTNENFAPIVKPIAENEYYEGNESWDPTPMCRDENGFWNIPDGYEVVGWSMYMNPYRPMINMSKSELQNFVIDSSKQKSLVEATAIYSFIIKAIADIRRLGINQWDHRKVAALVYVLTGLPPLDNDGKPLFAYRNMTGEHQESCVMDLQDVAKILLESGAIPEEGIDKMLWVLKAFRERSTGL